VDHGAYTTNGASSTRTFNHHNNCPSSFRRRRKELLYNLTLETSLVADIDTGYSTSDESLFPFGSLAELLLNFDNTGKSLAKTSTSVTRTFLLFDKSDNHSFSNPDISILAYSYSTLLIFCLLWWKLSYFPWGMMGHGVPFLEAGIVRTVRLAGYWQRLLRRNYVEVWASSR